MISLVMAKSREFFMPFHGGNRQKDEAQKDVLTDSRLC